MDEIVAKFLPRFASLARVRLHGGLEASAAHRGEAMPVVAGEMHALAGEAGLLGLGAVHTLAKRAEQAARLFGATRAEGDARRLYSCLRELENAVDEATIAIPV